MRINPRQRMVRDPKSIQWTRRRTMAMDTFSRVHGCVRPRSTTRSPTTKQVKILHSDLDLIDGLRRGRRRTTCRRQGQDREEARNAQRESVVWLGGGVGLATGSRSLRCSRRRRLGPGSLSARRPEGAALGAITGHAAAGMSRGDLKDLGEQLDKGQAGLVVVGASDMERQDRAGNEEGATA